MDSTTWKGFLSADYPRLSKRKSDNLKTRVAQEESRLSIGSAVVERLRADIESYAASAKQERVDSDLQAAMFRILLSRYAKLIDARDMFDRKNRISLGYQLPTRALKMAPAFSFCEFQLPYYFGSMQFAISVQRMRNCSYRYQPV